eukprot:scaffold427_cov263-Pinguiococcus_pyrenoidosus.AAC.11
MPHTILARLVALLTRSRESESAKSHRKSVAVRRPLPILREARKMKVRGVSVDARDGIGSRFNHPMGSLDVSQQNPSSSQKSLELRELQF